MPLQVALTDRNESEKVEINQEKQSNNLVEAGFEIDVVHRRLIQQKTIEVN